jgi:aldehyde dehydrogenase (NAD+)
VWINGTNSFDAAVGFGGYKESGFGREGGREGMAAYLKSAWEKELKPALALKATATKANENGGVLVSTVDQTAKMYIGGKQARPDSGYSRPVHGPGGQLLGEVGDGNRKDIRNAVEAARAALGWGTAHAHLRAQVLFFLAENLDYRRKEFAARIEAQTGKPGDEEVEQSIQRLVAFAGWADKYDGAVHNPPLRAVAAAMVEPIGVIGIVAPPSRPLLGSVALLAPAVAMGNPVVLVPSETSPLSVTDLYQVMETSDVPAGVINIVTGESAALAKTLAEHDGVDALWVAGSKELSTTVEQASIGNLKQTWTSRGLYYDLADDEKFGGDYFLRRATQIKNIWIPYGA